MLAVQNYMLSCFQNTSKYVRLAVLLLIHICLNAKC